MSPRTLGFSGLLAAGGLLWLAGVSGSQPVPERPAKPSGVIDAGDYESLQAALDAVPASGGIVRLPPGVYEITEPLRLHTGDTRLEGSGAATQIINRNDKGEPAQAGEQLGAGGPELVVIRGERHRGETGLRGEGGAQLGGRGTGEGGGHAEAGGGQEAASGQRRDGESHAFLRF